MSNVQNRNVTDRRKTGDFSPKPVASVTSQGGAPDENYFRDLVTNSALGICIIQDECIVYANTSFANMHGYDLSEVLGQKITGLICEQDGNRFLEFCADHKAGAADADQLAVRCKRKDGSIVRLELSASATHWNGKPATQIALSDTNELRCIKQQLAESERRVNAMTNAVPDAVISIDSENIIQTFNPAAERIFGYTASEAVGSLAEILMPESSRVKHNAGMHRFLETGDSRIIGKRHEVLAQRKDGSTFPLEIAINWMEVPEGVMFVGVCQDITERKKAEEALVASEARSRESKHRLSAMMNAVPDAVVTIDADNIIQSFNPAAERTFGYSASEAVGQSARILMPVEAQQRHEDGLSRFLATGEGKIIGRRNEVTGLRKDGTTFPLELAINWMEIPDGLMFVGVCQDITARKKSEHEKSELEQTLQQSHKMEAIGTLAGGIAHDINNTLVPILGLVELLQLDFEPEDESYDSLEMIRTASERIKELVGQILTFSRKEDERNKVIEIGEAVDDTLPLLRSTIPSTVEIHSEVDLEAGLVSIGPAQIHQIILNLSTNASLAMEDGGTLAIATKRIDVDHEFLEKKKDLKIQTGTYALISVADSGCGIEEETLAKIFDPFFTTRGVGEGTGMGLSVVHGIISGCGGGVHVSSEVGKGTNFELYLPIVTEGQIQLIDNEENPEEGMELVSQALA